MWGQRSGGGGGRRRRGVAVECRDDADAGGSEGDGSGDVSVRARVAVAVECRCDAGLSPSSVAAVDDRAGEWASEAEASVLGGGGGGLSWGTGGGCRGERLNELVSCWVGSIFKVSTPVHLSLQFLHTSSKSRCDVACYFVLLKEIWHKFVSINLSHPF